MPGDSDIYRGKVTQRTPLNQALCAIWYRLWQLTGFSSSGSGGIVITPQIVNRVPFKIAASGTQAIPTGAKGYGWTVTAGTASDGTVTDYPVGYSQSDANTLAAGFILTTASASAVYGYYNT